MQELSAWIEYTKTMPAYLEVFSNLDEDVKSQLVAQNPMQVCRWKFPQVVSHVEQFGGIDDTGFWRDIEHGLIEKWEDRKMEMGHSVWVARRNFLELDIF